MQHGKLSVVATPIGNLEDITLRALRTLREADYVLCEDTRVTSKLCARHEIKPTLKRYDAHASAGTHTRIIEDLQNGMKIALVSDAGTPTVSDPGVLLVRAAREAGIPIETIPGPAAVTAALSIAGIPGNTFTFLGFVPHKKGRKTFFETLPLTHGPVVFYESPHRIMKALEALVHVYNGRGHRITIARELTKMHEEVVAGSSVKVLQYFTDHPDHVRGEFVVIVSE
jgi:16S rRNA (cytidine1402-2'-O)-methyltransferase